MLCFVFFNILEGSAFSCKVKLVVQPFCTTQLLVSYNAVSISCECYKAETAQTVGGSRPRDFACVQTEQCHHAFQCVSWKKVFHGVSIYLEVVRSQEVLSGDFLPVSAWLTADASSWTCQRGHSAWEEEGGQWGWVNADSSVTSKQTHQSREGEMEEQCRQSRGWCHCSWISYHWREWRSYGSPRGHLGVVTTHT